MSSPRCLLVLLLGLWGPAGVVPCVAQAPPPDPVAAQAPAPTEKELRAEFKKALKKKDPTLRLEAVLEYSAGTRELPEQGGEEKLVAKTLALVLDDADMAVRNAALEALSWGRHVATVIDVCDEALESARYVLEKTSTRPDEESRALYRGAVTVYRAACAVLANYRDDRSVTALETELRVLRPGGQLESISQSLVRPVAGALLSLGSARAVELVIEQTKVYSASTLGGTSPWERLLATLARNLHETLADFAVSVERAPPPFTQNYQQDWRAWFKKQRKLFPPQLGKLQLPPGPPADPRRARGGRSHRPQRP